MSRESIETFQALKDVSAKYWLALIISPILAFTVLAISNVSLWGIAGGLLYVLVFCQSVRGLLFVRRARIKLQSYPGEVSKGDVMRGPIIIGIPGLQWFVSLTRWEGANAAPLSNLEYLTAFKPSRNDIYFSRTRTWCSGFSDDHFVKWTAYILHVFVVTHTLEHFGAKATVFAKHIARHIKR